MELIRCLFCGKKTTLHSVNMPKRIRGKVVTLTNAPVYYCKDCDETFISKEAQQVFRYIKDNNLDQRRILFNFEDLVGKVN